MTDLKISQLFAATALAGTEVVPVVQGGSGYRLQGDFTYTV